MDLLSVGVLHVTAHTTLCVCVGMCVLCLGTYVCIYVCMHVCAQTLATLACVCYAYVSMYVLRHALRSFLCSLYVIAGGTHSLRSCVCVCSMSETGRVVRRHSKYANFYFIELILPTGIRSSVFVDRSRNLPTVHAGDAVRIRVQTELNDKCANCLSAVEIEIFEKWDVDTFGSFSCVHSPVGVVHVQTVVAAVQAHNGVIRRICLYLQTKYSSYAFKLSDTMITKSQDRLIAVAAFCGAGTGRDICELVLQDSVLAYAVSRVYCLDDSVAGLTVEEVAQRFDTHKAHNAQSAHNTHITHNSHNTYRIHAFPKSANLLPLATLGSFSPTEYSHVISIVFIDGLFHASLLPKESAVGTGAYIGDTTLISKAEAKLAEVFARIGPSGVSTCGSLCVPKCMCVGIDIGASPGGWSNFLVTRRNMAKVIAVDNGMMNSTLSSKVEHWKMKGEEAINILLGTGLSNKGLACFVCDMNVDLTETVALFVKALPLMADKFIGVLTFKQTIRNTQIWERLVQQGINILNAEISHDYEIRRIHLIANTPNETTIIVTRRDAGA